MKLGAPEIATLLWIVPVMTLFYHLADKAWAAAVNKFVNGPPAAEITRTVPKYRRRMKKMINLGALFFMILALMRPQWGFTWEEVKRQGIDIMIALDTSNSMLAEDVKPNRLERSLLAIKDLVHKLKGDRVGLIAFSGTAFLQCPLTIDYNGFLLALNDISVETIPVGGTSLANAIYTAIDSYEGGGKKHRVIIVITDGEDLEGGAEEAALKAKSKGVTIFCVGIGTKEGELIPVRTPQGKMEFLKDEKGNVVRTRIDEETLQRIAVETGGIYVRATGAEFGLDVIYDQKLSKLEKEELKSRMEKKYKERFQLPLLAAVILLLLGSVIGDRRRDVQ
jgi:Ca-activated chloride channel family protein